jgi:hypothetical protein
MCGWIAIVIDHPNFNKGTTSWAESNFGKEFASFKHSVLPMSKQITLAAAKAAAALEGTTSNSSVIQPTYTAGTFVSLNSISSGMPSNVVEIDFLIPGGISLSHRDGGQESKRSSFYGHRSAL